MSNFITAGAEYNGKEAVEILYRPLKEKFEPMGIRVVDTMGAGSYKMTFIGKLLKVLRKYASGWRGGSGANLKQVEFELKEMKGEFAIDKQDYLDIIQVESLRLANNVANDITETTIAQAQRNVFANGVNDDLHRLFWLADTAKLHNSAGTYHDGTSFAVATEDENYSAMDGVWKKLIRDQAPYATATEDQVRRVDVAAVATTAAVAEVETITVTGTSGTATVTVEGKDYTITFDSSLSSTTSGFVTTEAANILANHDIVLTRSGADLIFTSNTAGVAITTSIANASGDLAGSVATTTANVQAAFASDDVIDLFGLMFDNSTEELIGMHDDASGESPLVIYATRSIINSYRKALQSTGATEQAYTATIEGVKYLAWNGIPIVPMAIDASIKNDFRSKYPHRAILTVAENLATVVASANGRAEALWWYEKKDNTNMQRVQLETGAGYLLPELITIAY